MNVPGIQPLVQLRLLSLLKTPSGTETQAFQGDLIALVVGTRSCFTAFSRAFAVAPYDSLRSPRLVINGTSFGATSQGSGWDTQNTRVSAPDGVNRRDRHRGRAHPGRVIRPAARLGKGVEAALDQHRLQAVIKHMTRRARHLRPAHHQIPLTSLLPSHRHRQTPLQIREPENQTAPTWLCLESGGNLRMA